LSAKWRRNKKNPKWFSVFRTLNKAGDRSTPGEVRTKTSRVRRYAYLPRCRTQNTRRERRWREPEPLIDVLEGKNEITVVAEFAGFKRENLIIHVKNQQLTLSAEALDRTYHKSLNLPKRVIPSNIHATCKNGVLKIRLKKAIEEKAIDRVADWKNAS
jgi:HSP20 family molecular chaperone IbpA